MRTNEIIRYCAKERARIFQAIWRLPDGVFKRIGIREIDRLGNIMDCEFSRLKVGV